MRGFYKDFLTLSLFKTKSHENIDFNPDHPRLFYHNTTLSAFIFSSKPMALSQRRKIIRKPWNAEFREQLCTIVKIITKRHSTSVEEWIS